MTTEEYVAERGYDCSIEEPIHIQLPSKTLASGMSLQWSGTDGIFSDSTGKAIAFDPAVAECGPHALLIRQEEFEKYLASNELSFFWTVLGAKQGMHGRMSRDEWNGELQVSGIYQLIDGEVTGELWTKFISRDRNIDN